MTDERRLVAFNSKVIVESSWLASWPASAEWFHVRRRDALPRLLGRTLTCGAASSASPASEAAEVVGDRLCGVCKRGGLLARLPARLSGLLLGRDSSVPGSAVRRRICLDSERVWLGDEPEAAAADAVLAAASVAEAGTEGESE